MSIDITQQALNALADAGLGNDSPAEAYVIGYTQGHDDALALAIQLERSINRRPFMPDEAERLAMRLHEQVGDCPIAHESGKAMDDSANGGSIGQRAHGRSLTGRRKRNEER